MKKKVNLDSATFWFLYTRYKQYLLPVSVIFVCILLFIFLIIPQFQSFSDTQQQTQIESNKLLILKNNLNLLTNIDESQMDSELQIVSVALPPNKDFSGVLDGISVAANKSGVFLGDYEFQVGNISTPSISIQSFPSLQITLKINGGVSGVTRFITELYKTVPLSEVSSVKVSNSDSEITALFYYKPFPPLGFNSSLPINTVSPQGLSVINTLSSWNNAVKVIVPAVQQSSASSSGGINPNPF